MKLKKVVLIGLPVLFAFFGLRFALWRHSDKTAWPERDAETDFNTAPDSRPNIPAPKPPAFFDDAVAQMPAPLPALVDEYLLYQKAGIQANGAYPEIEKQMALAPLEFPSPRFAGHDDKFVFNANCHRFDESEGYAGFTGFIGRLSELAILSAYRFDVIADPAERAEWFTDSLAGMRNLICKGGGGIGALHVTLNNTMLMVRALAMNPIAFATEDEAAALISALRLLEREYDGESFLANAIRADKISFGESVGKIYANLKGKSALIIRVLGGNEADTRANLDALFSRLIANAGLPYSPDGITAGLPEWCAGKGRIPWTRDHIGASVAQSYLRHAVFAAALHPSVTLELRAARIITALEFFKTQHGAYPETAEELIAAGLVDESDFADPFATEITRLSYARDGGGWRFWSVGFNQQNDGGLANAYHAAKDTDLKKTDLVFTSREREIRNAQ